MHLSRATLREPDFGPRVPRLSVLRWTLTLIALLASSAASAVASEAEVAQTTSQAKAAPGAGSAQLKLQQQASWHAVSWQVGARWIDALAKLRLTVSLQDQQPVTQLAQATSALAVEQAHTQLGPRSALLRAALQPRAPPSC